MQTIPWYYDELSLQTITRLLIIINDQRTEFLTFFRVSLVAKFAKVAYQSEHKVNHNECVGIPIEIYKFETYHSVFTWTTVRFAKIILLWNSTSFDSRWCSPSDNC